MAWLPTMIEHRCSIGERGGFFQRLRQGTYPGHILEHVTLELHVAGRGRRRLRPCPGDLRSRACTASSSSTSRRRWRGAAWRWGASWCWRPSHDRPFDVKGEVQKLRELAEEVLLGPSTDALVEAARGRGIPARRLNTNSLVQLGQGSRQRRIQAAETDRTGAIAEEIAQDKELTRMLLAAVGVPVPEGRPVADAEDAWAAAVEIGAARGRQAARRQSGPRRGHQPDHPGAGDRRLSGRPGGEPRQAGRRGALRRRP